MVKIIWFIIKNPLDSWKITDIIQSMKELIQSMNEGINRERYHDEKIYMIL